MVEEENIPAEENKSVEPIQENEAVSKEEPVTEKIEEVIIEAAADGVVTPEELAAIEKAKEEAETEEKRLDRNKKAREKRAAEKATDELEPDKEKVEATEKKETAVEKKVSKNVFPKVEVCSHPNTKRVLARGNRVVHMCTNPACNKVVKVGGR